MQVCYYINKCFYKNDDFLLYYNKENAVIDLSVLNLQINEFFLLNNIY